MKHTVTKFGFQPQLHGERPRFWDNSERTPSYHKESSGTINRGHFAAVADFPFFSQQVATCNMKNQAPQFVKVNDGNWEDLERHVRNHAEVDGDLTVWTGRLVIKSFCRSRRLSTLSISGNLPGKRQR